MLCTCRRPIRWLRAEGPVVCVRCRRIVREGKRG
jgi:hypothetical protein